jgi:hypothetical protein
MFQNFTYSLNCSVRGSKNLSALRQSSIDSGASLVIDSSKRGIISSVRCCFKRIVKRCENTAGVLMFFDLITDRNSLTVSFEIK